MLTDVEVVRFYLLLCVFDRAADPSMFDWLAIFHSDPAHEAFQAVGAEDAEQVVFQRHVEAGRAGIALTTRSSAELIIDAAGVVAFSASKIQTPRRAPLFALSPALRPVFSQGITIFRIVQIARACLRRGHELSVSP